MQLEAFKKKKDEPNLKKPTKEQQSVVSNYVMRIKLLMIADENTPKQIRMDVLSENDLYLYYTYTMEEEIFKKVQADQKLSVNFPTFHHMLIKLLNNCIKEPSVYTALITIKEGESQLVFSQNTEYKKIDILLCNLACANKEALDKQIAYRYGTQKCTFNTAIAKLQELNNVVQKNPTLAAQMDKLLHKSDK